MVTDINEANAEMRKASVLILIVMEDGHWLTIIRDYKLKVF